MFLTEMSLFDLVKKQYKFKLQAYMRVFSSLMATQLIAILISLTGVGSSGTGTDGIQLNITYYSADVVIGLTMVWAFLSSILVTTKAYRFDDFAFVATRLSSNLANALFLLTTSIVGGVTAMLSGYLLKTVIFLINGTQLVQGDSVFHAPNELLVGIFVSILYIFLFSGLGYLIGTVIQIYKPLIVILPIAFIGISFMRSMGGEGPIIEVFFQFFFKEASVWIFFLKVLISSAFLFSSAAAISNRMGVRN